MGESPEFLLDADVETPKEGNRIAEQFPRTIAEMERRDEERPEPLRVAIGTAVDDAVEAAPARFMGVSSEQR